jgi:nucleotide-binding universal stress UspA family protein
MPLPTGTMRPPSLGDRELADAALPRCGMTALRVEHGRVEQVVGKVAIVSRDPSVRWRLSAAAEELAPSETAWLEIVGVGSSERAVAQDIARRIEERNADVVVMTVSDARIAADRVLARRGAVLAVPPAWRPGAGFTRIAVGYDGSEPADAAVEAARALAVAHCGRALRVEVVHVDDSALAAGELDGDVVNSRRVAVIEWWLAQAARPIPAAVGVIRRTGDPVTVLAELSSDFELLVIGTHGRASLRRIVGRSGFKELIEATQCPVLIVPRSLRWRSKTAEREPAGCVVDNHSDNRAA